MNSELSRISLTEARKFYHGNHMGASTNLHPIADLFPYSDTWDINSWDNRWCAAFVFYCLYKAGYSLPVKHEKVSCNFARCEAWEEWAKLSEVNKWYNKEAVPEIGDIVLFDNLFIPSACDHMGIVVQVNESWIETAEGNYCNISAVIKRPYDNIRGYIRL